MSVVFDFIALVIFLICYGVSLLGTLAIIFVAFLSPAWLKGVAGKWRFLCWLVLSVLSVSIHVVLARHFHSPDGCFIYCSGNYQDLYNAVIGYGINTLYLFAIYLICTHWVGRRIDTSFSQELPVNQPYYRRVEEFSPSFLSDFEARLVKFTDIGAYRYPQENYPHYICRQLICECGEDRLHLSVSSVRNKFLKRLWSGKHVSYQPSVFASCPRCGSTSVAFDQKLHGWDARFHEIVNSDWEPHKVYNSQPQEVYVGLSYQWLNHYERAVLENETIGADLENYIDHIDFYIGSSKRSELVFGFRCSLSENHDYDW